MSAIAPIVINDGQATPVAHTFNPVKSGPVSQFRENISSLALIGQGTIDTKVVLDSGNGLNKVTLTLTLPALEVSTGSNTQGYTAAPKVGYTNKVSMTFFLPTRGTAAQRTDLRTMARNLLANPQLIDVVDNVLIPY